MMSFENVTKPMAVPSALSPAVGAWTIPSVWRGPAGDCSSWMDRVMDGLNRSSRKSKKRAFVEGAKKARWRRVESCVLNFMMVER